MPFTSTKETKTNPSSGDYRRAIFGQTWSSVISPETDKNTNSILLEWPAAAAAAAAAALR